MGTAVWVLVAQIPSLLSGRSLADKNFAYVAHEMFSIGLLMKYTLFSTS